MVFWKSENYLSSINLTIWFEQVAGSDIWQVSHSGFIADRPAQMQPGFTVSAPKVEAFVLSFLTNVFNHILLITLFIMYLLLPTLQ